MPSSPDEKPAQRFIAAARRLNRQPKLLRATRQTRERLLGGDEALVDHLDPGSVTAKNRRFRAKGAPKELAAYALTRASG